MKFIVVVMAIDSAQRLSEQETKVAEDIKRSIDYILLNKYSTKLVIEENSSPTLIIKKEN